MITFKSLKWKNFLSTGNNWSEIDFIGSPTTLVVGHNGSGKSTMLDALSFALFGKAHRNISNYGPSVCSAKKLRASAGLLTFLATLCVAMCVTS